MELSYDYLELEKRVPLTISRGTESHSRVFWVRLAGAGLEGWGEAAAFSVGAMSEGIPEIKDGLEIARDVVKRIDPHDQDSAIFQIANAGLPFAVHAALDQALWDWTGKKRHKPVWQIVGGSRDPRISCVTVGIAPPEAAAKRVQQWQELGARAFKVKLGNPAGIEADQRMMEAILNTVPTDATVCVDANGGWSPADTVSMSKWLHERGIAYIEQPLIRGREHELAAIRKQSPLPFILDESVFDIHDLRRLHAFGGFDGVNVKLMKTRGLSGALELLRGAWARGLQTLIGCYGHSALANTAAAHLAGFADYLDLDSHLNLKRDPFTGPRFESGCIVLSDQPGLGVSYAT